MKKIVTLGILSLVILFLAGCGQQQVDQVQPIVPVPVVEQPAQPVATQPVPVAPINTPNYIEVKELGFKIPVDASMVGDLTYIKMEGPAVIFSSKSLNTVNKNCGDGASGPVISKIMGTPSRPADGAGAEFYTSRMSDIKQFAGFFLIYHGPQDSCTLGKRVDLESKVAQTVFVGFKNVVLIEQ
jgi:hypothetical protein